MDLRDKTTHGARSWRIGTLVVAALALVLFGCDQELGMEYEDAGEGGQEGQPGPGEYDEEGSTDEVEVTRLRLGRDLEDHKTITRQTRRFHPQDTVFLEVIMRGTADDVWLTSRWYHGDELIETRKHRSSPDGTEATEMHIGRGPDALPVGDYIVEVRLNETVVEALPFQVVPENQEGQVEEDDDLEDQDLEDQQAE